MTNYHMGTFFTNAEKSSFSNELYNFTPSYKNFYTVSVSSSDSDNSSYNNYLKFFAKAVHFDNETLNLERNPITKNFTVKERDSFSWVDTLRITYTESSLWDVKIFHENWLSLIYDRTKDEYKSYDKGSVGSSGIYKTIKITFPTLQGIEESKTIQFNNVIPRNAGAFDFAWGTSPQLNEHQIEYYVTSWEWEGSSTQKSVESPQSESTSQGTQGNTPSTNQNKSSSVGFSNTSRSGTFKSNLMKDY